MDCIKRDHCKIYRAIFINLINIYWMGSYNIWGQILSAGDVAVNQTNEFFALTDTMVQ